VVLGVPRCVVEVEAAAAAEVEDVPVGDPADAFLRDRGAVAVHGVEQVAVDPPGARVEPLGVDEVAGADLADHHLGGGEGLGDVAGPPAWSRWMWLRTR
jgi:hypothetical protein